MSLIELKKTEFRTEVMNSVNPAIKEVSMKAKDLYKNKNNIEWKHNNEEVLINGVYHDVLKIKKFKDKVIVYLVADEKENDLVNNYRSFTKKTSSPLAELLKVLLNFNYLETNLTGKVSLAFKPGKPFISSMFFNENDFTNSLIKPPRV